MSKELEALKTIIGVIAYVDLRDLDRESIDKSLEIIENALKTLEMYENVVGIDRIKETNKKEKALEIIKKKVIDFNYFWTILMENDEISQEEYDLLKEVLL